MANNTCDLNAKIYNTFSNKVSVPTKSNAHDWAERLKLVETGKEIMARGQGNSEVDAEAIRDVLKKLNLAMGDCTKLDERSGRFDRELEQRVALFQERHLASQNDLGHSKVVDGVIGEKTLNKLTLVAAGKQPVGGEYVGQPNRPTNDQADKDSTRGSQGSSKILISEEDDRRLSKLRAYYRKMGEKADIENKVNR